MVKHSQCGDERFFGIAIHDVTRSLSLLDEAGFRLSSFYWFLELRVLQGFKWGDIETGGQSCLGCFIKCVACIYSGNKKPAISGRFFYCGLAGLIKHRIPAASCRWL